MKPNGPKHPKNHRLTPEGHPRYVRCYDNGEQFADRYTVVFNGPRIRQKCGGEYPYLSMSARPFHPQGIGMHDSGPRIIDAPKGWTTPIGGKNHLGVRIPFSDLPPDCQTCVWQDYSDIWGVKKP